MLKFVMPIGIEGTGHSLLRQMLKPAFEQQAWVDEAQPLFDRLLNAELIAPRRKATPLRQRLSDVVRGKGAPPAIPDLREALASYVNASRTYYMSPSYPFGHVDRPYKMPSIKGVMEFLTTNAPGEIDWKFIFLKREVKSTVYSCIRRGHNTDPKGACAELQAGVLFVEDALRFLQHKGVPFHEMDYSATLRDPLAASVGLAAFLGIPHELIDVSAVRKPSEVAQALDYIENYFRGRVYDFHGA